MYWLVAHITLNLTQVMH